MPTTGEYKTVHSRRLIYAQEIGWTYVTRAEVERRRGFSTDGGNIRDRRRTTSLFLRTYCIRKSRNLIQAIMNQRNHCSLCFNY
jgi:type I restriction enzyme R subunit